MTRDFSKQERDDRQSSSRDTFSDGHREERSFKPARPRLSRDTVDRAWENGASRRYSDYRPRQNSQTPPVRNQGRFSPSSERSQRSQGHESYNAHPEPFSTSSSTSNQGHQSRQEEAPEDGARRPYGAGRRVPERQGSDREHWTRNQRGTTPEAGEYPGQHRQERPPRYNQGGPKGTVRGNYRENSQRRFERQERPPHYNQDTPQGPVRTNHWENNQRSFDHQERPSRYNQDSPGRPIRTNYREDDQRRFERQERPPRYNQGGPKGAVRRNYQGNDQRRFERQERPPRYDQGSPRGAVRTNHRENDQPSFGHQERRRDDFARGRRPGDAPARHDDPNPRWQSHPNARHTPPTPQRDRVHGQPEPERFEGDYERFNTYESDRKPERVHEKHVTRQPDGRVLKGTRPAQRKQARFWEDVTSETRTLLPQNPKVPETVVQPDQTPEPSTENSQRIKPVRPPLKHPERKTKVVKTVKTARARDIGPKAGKVKPKRKKATRAQGPVMRPSQRGFKWPTTGE